MASLKLFLFGPPRLELDGTPVEFQRRKALALLVYLASSGQAHSRDALATLFWPDHSQRRARTYLRRDLAVLNTSPVGTWLAISGDTVELKRTGDFWLDVEHFGRLLSGCQSHAHAAAVVCSECLSLLTAAATLYTDDFLAGFTLRDSREFDDWQFFQAESLRQELASVLERLVRGLSSQQEYEAAIPHARRWLNLDPLHEPVHYALMQLYARSGRQAAALRQYEECVRLLDEEFGISPQEETTALFEAIKAKQTPLAGPPIQMLPFLEQTEIPASPGTAQFMPAAGPPGHPSPFLDGDSTATEAESYIFVARQHELAQLNDLLEVALAGQNRVAFVTGEAGQGKTILLQEFAWQAQAARPNLIVASGNCNAYTGVGDPYLPFREILEMLTGDVEARAVAGTLRRNQANRLWHALPTTVQALVEAGPDLLDTFIPAQALLKRAGLYAPKGTDWLSQLQALIATTANRPGQASVRQSDLFEQYTRVVQALARQAPLLLILDDLQWADLGSTNLLFHLGRRLTGYPVLIVGAYRPAEVAMGRPALGLGYVPSPLAPSGGAGQVERHPLERVVNEFQRNFGDIILDLSRAEGQAFVDALLDNEPNRLSLSFRETLYRQTGGHPLFTIELLRGMQERGDLVQDEAGQWVEQPGLDWDSLPARVEGAIGERISRMALSLQELLQVASVEGEDFTAELVAKVLDVEVRKVVRQLSHELEKTHRLVRALGIKRVGSLRLSRYRFRHILIQRYLYNTLDDVEQGYLNEAVGNAFESLYGEQTAQIAGQLARYFRQAGIPEKAVRYLFQAGLHASRLSAHEEAIGHFTQALALLETLPDTPERVQQELELQIALGPALIAAKGYSVPEVKLAYSRAHELVQQGEETPQRFRVIFGLWGFYLVRAELHRTRALGEQALSLARRLQDPALLLEAHRALGMTLFHLGEFTRARVHLEQGSAIYDPQQHGSLAFLSVADPGVTCLSYLARTLWHLGFPDQAVSKSYESLNLAQTLAHPFSLAAALVYTARVHQCRREAPATQQQAEAAIALSIEQSFPHYIAMGTVLQGWAMAQQEQEAGITQLRQGLIAGQNTQIEVARPHFLAMLAEAYGQAGQVKEGLGVLAEALALGNKNGEGQWEAEIYRLKGELLLRDEGGTGSEELSPEDCFLKAVETARSQQSKSLELRATASLARLWQSQGKRAEARRMLAEIYNWFTEGFDTVDLREAKALLDALS